METLFKLFFLIAFPLATGAGTYFICREIKHPSESFIQFIVSGGILLFPVGFSVATSFNGPLDLGFVLLNISGGNYLVVLLLLVGMSWLFGGRADAKVFGTLSSEWISSHFLIYAATMTSWLIGAFNISISHLILGKFVPFLREPSSWMVYLLLLSVSPAMMPILIQFNRWAKLLPGFRAIY